MTPEQRVLRARLAAFASHVGHAPGERTVALRRGFDAQFARTVRERFPDLTDQEDIDRRAKLLRAEYFARLTFKASVARARKAGRHVAPDDD